MVAEIELDGKFVLEPSHHVVDGGLGQVLLAKDPVERLDNFRARVPLIGRLLHLDGNQRRIVVFFGVERTSMSSVAAGARRPIEEPVPEAAFVLIRRIGIPSVRFLLPPELAQPLADLRGRHRGVGGEKLGPRRLAKLNVSVLWVLWVLPAHPGLEFGARFEPELLSQLVVAHVLGVAVAHDHVVRVAVGIVRLEATQDAHSALTGIVVPFENRKQRRRRR